MKRNKSPLFSKSKSFAIKIIELSRYLNAEKREYVMSKQILPEYVFLDTLAASRRYFGRLLPNHRLQTVAAACGFDLCHHHHALADAEACAAIAMKLL